MPGLNLEGRKEVLGLYLSESEGPNFWLGVLTDMHNRGVKDILIASVDGLAGFPEAIQAIYPDTEVQLCIVHQIRNSLRYVGSKHQKAFMVDLKRVYQMLNKAAAESALDELEQGWGDKYPIVIRSWRKKRDNLPKLLYPGIRNARKKWTMPIHNWNLTLSQLATFFEGGIKQQGQAQVRWTDSDGDEHHCGFAYTHPAAEHTPTCTAVNAVCTPAHREKS